jgi:hypothetical protein
MKMKRNLLMVVIALTSFLSSVTGQEQKETPAQASTKNLSGAWKMNPDKSKFNGDKGPKAITIIFDQQGQYLRESMAVGYQGERKLELKYALDGKEAVNQVGGEQVKGIARWEGDELVIELKGGRNPFRRRFTFSEGGKVMTMVINHSETDGEKTDTIVLEKQ